MTKKTDLRIVRSRHSIKKAFIELLNEKGYEGITIQDIADKAMINRNTFYLHYQNKPDLLNASMDELLEELQGTLNLCSSSRASISGAMLEQLMQTILEKIRDNKPFYQALLLEENRIYGFQSKMEEIIKNTVESGLDETSLSISKDLLLQYIASTFMGIVVWWVKNEFAYTPEELSAQFGKILVHGHFEAAGIAVKD